MPQILHDGTNVLTGAARPQGQEATLLVVDDVAEFDYSLDDELTDLLQTMTVKEVEELLHTGQFTADEIKAAERAGKNRAGVLGL